MKEETKYQCVSLIGELADWGKHILLPYGITLCGMPTVDVNKEEFPQLKTAALSDIISEYKVEEWNITCKKCLEIVDILSVAEEKKKAKNN